MDRSIQKKFHEKPQRYPLALAGTIALFTILGLAIPIYASIAPLFSIFFKLKPAYAIFTESLFNIAFLVLALPGCLVLRRLGYKIGLILGVCGMACGALLLYPAIIHHQYSIFLLAIVAMGGGYSWLEASANSLVVLMGGPSNAVLRLNFAHTFYPVGLIAGLFVTDVIVATHFHEASATLLRMAERPYLIIGLTLVFLAFLVENIDFPRVAAETEAKRRRAFDDFRALVIRSDFRRGMAAQVAAVVSRTCIWVAIPYYLRERFPGQGITAADVLLWSWIAYAVGRFVGTFLMTLIRPEHLLSAFSCGALCLAAVASITGGSIGLASLVGISFFMSIMFPTVFGLAICGEAPLTKAASGLITASSGFGLVIASLAVSFGIWNPALFVFVVSAVSFSLILLYALTERPDLRYDRAKDRGYCQND